METEGVTPLQDMGADVMEAGALNRLRPPKYYEQDQKRLQDAARNTIQNLRDVLTRKNRTVRSLIVALGTQDEACGTHGRAQG